MATVPSTEPPATPEPAREPDRGSFRSLWLDTVDRREWPALAEDLRVDVAIAGGGIVGLTAALLLAREGASVAVLEGRRVAGGVSGYTTAKLSSLHGLTYARLRSRHGAEAARAHGEANEAGIARIAALVDELEIDCDFRRKPNYTYAEPGDDVSPIEDEVSAAQAAGLPATYTEDHDLPFPIAAAIRFDDQAEFHPVKYLLALARAAEDAGVRIFERSWAIEADEGSHVRVETSTGVTVTARQLIVATHLPFLDRGLFFARTHPERSYVVAAEVEQDLPHGMYLSTESPSHSIRTHRLDDGRRFLLVGGESHKPGHADSRERYDRLVRYARERFGVHAIDRHWASQDNMPADGLPFIGPLHPGARGVHVATGFKKWGLAMGTTAAAMLADAIAGRDNPWAETYTPNRLRLRAGAPSFLKANAEVAKDFVGDRLTRRAGADELAPGEGAVVGAGLGQRAVYRDEGGKLHTLSARCTHLGCIVRWNGAEKTWDCPCHGSRFGVDGEVRQGPAVRGLPRQAPDQPRTAASTG